LSLENAEVSTVPLVPYEQLTIGVPRETFPNERRVAISPTAVAQYTKQGFKVIVEQGAGLNARFTDQDYIDAGATIKSTKDVYNTSDIILKVGIDD